MIYITQNLKAVRTALIPGILYLTFQAFPIIFGRVHGFNVQMTGLSFIGIGIGMVLALCSQPLWDKLNARMMVKHNGSPPPEARLIIVAPYSFAFFSVPHAVTSVPFSLLVLMLDI